MTRHLLSSNRITARACGIATIIGLSCLAALAGSPTPPFISSIDAAVANAAAASSISVHRSARHALSFFHMRYRLWQNQYVEPMTAFFKCEKVVEPYCYGPANGSLPFGAPGLAHPVLLRTDPSVLSPKLAKRMDYEVVSLLRALDAAQKKIPADKWIMGQRVFHRVQHGEHDAALTAARECRTEQWWCVALVGFVSTVQNQMHRADSAFSVALSARDAQSRCKWEDASDLLWDDGDRSWYTRLSCEAKKGVNETLWWLADPLYSEPGNERRNEHYFREVFRTLFLDSNSELPVRTIGRRVDTMQNPPINVKIVDELGRFVTIQVFEQRIWNHGALNSVLRSVGVPPYFMVDADRSQWTPDTIPPILLQYPQPNYHFLPDLAAVRDPMRAAAEHWDLLDPQAVERYHPAFGAFEPLEHQTAYFKRGDSSRMIAAANVRGNKLYSANGTKLFAAALVLTKSQSDIRLFRDSIPGSLITFSSIVPSESTLVSIEGKVSGVGAMRVRFASGPPPMPSQRVTMSDVLMLQRRADFTLANNLDDATREALPRTTVSQGSSVALFWEMYGLTQGDSIIFTMSATEKSTSTLTQIGRVLGIAGRATGAGTTWTEALQTAQPTEPRAVGLDLSTLQPGRYVLALEAAVLGQVPIKVVRDIIVER